jgi:hypothetical protein
MKKLLKVALSISAISLVNMLAAQDSMYLSDGKNIVVKVLEIETSAVKYKKYSNLDGPTYTVEKSKILRVRYINGDEEIFQQPAPSPDKTVGANVGPVPTKPQNGNKIFIKIEADELAGLSSEVKNLMRDWKHFDVVLKAEDADFTLQVTTLKKGMTFWTNTSVSSKAIMYSKSGDVLWESDYYKATSAIYNGYNSLHGSLKKLFNNGLKKKFI